MASGYFKQELAALDAAGACPAPRGQEDYAPWVEFPSPEELKLITLPNGEMLDAPEALGLRESKLELPAEKAVFGDHLTSPEERDQIETAVTDTGILVMEPLLSVEPAAKYRLRYKEYAQLAKLAAYRKNLQISKCN